MFWFSVERTVGEERKRLSPYQFIVYRINYNYSVNKKRFGMIQNETMVDINFTNFGIKVVTVKKVSEN